MEPTSNAWFVGEGSLLIQAATTWRELGHTVAGVASSDASIRGWADAHGIRVVPPDAFVAEARQTPFDYLFSVVNLTLLGDDALGLPKKVAVNFHDGYLPSYAGINATVWALLNGEPTHGVTWHEMTTGADEGRILVQRAFEVSPNETAFSLNAKCFTAGIETFRELAEQITAGTLAPTPQNLAERTYFDFYDRPENAMVLAFDAPADTLAQCVRALDFGAYPNPVGTAKILLPGDCLSVSEAEVLGEGGGAAPGTVLAVDEGGLTVATGSQPLRLGKVRSPSGATLDAKGLSELGIRTGTVLPIPSSELRTTFTEANAQAARSEGAMIRSFASSAPLSFSPGSKADGAQGAHGVRVAVPAGTEGHTLASLFLLFLARRTGQSTFDVGFANPLLREKTALAPALFASEVPLRVSAALNESVASGLLAVDEACRKAGARFPYARDLFLRQPQIQRPVNGISLLVDVPLAGPLPEGELAALVDTRSASVELRARADRIDADGLGRLAQRFELFLAGVRDGGAVLSRVPLVTETERRSILEGWNATARAVPDSECLHESFEARARKTPDQVAITARGKTLTYRELDRRANALAHVLKQQGAGPDVRIGIYAERSTDLVVAMLGVHKAGAAYVPLDPRYPAERVRFMMEDSGLSIVLCDKSTAPSLPANAGTRIVLDDGSLDAGADAPPDPTATSAHLAYVIYTSGSTGKPKGVMVEHRNVVNFLCAMDDVLGADPSGTWLAVTSLSFDISVLEIYWTLTRGLHLVLFAGDSSAAPAPRPVDFSVFYFSSEQSGGGPEHYRLLFEGARFADEHGFTAVWTPERHFHAFGGLYPNPAVTSAALAMVTKRVKLRAGSCVSPLHSPLRIAEEWSLVDNLSNGRAGLSFASGWQPNDFAIRPEAFARRREQMLEDIDAIRRLWRGERLPFKNGNGKDVMLATLPRPVQPELPVWVTAAGSPDTFEAAGRIGANLLTHLLGQTFAEVGEKVRAYRAAWEKAGHPGRGIVTIMLHTFVGSDRALVKEAVRKPMKEYLKSAVGLIKEAAWSFPTFKQRLDQGTFSTDQLSPEEMDALLDHSFERYYKTSGLFGTVEDALEVVDHVRGIDVDEIACLIDFGVPTDEVLAHLPLLSVVHERAKSAPERASGEALGDLFNRHAVTHFQCTPSMASMLVQDADTTAGLSRLQAMLVGGEALPLSLARQLRNLVPGALINVYGPTETAIWSTSHRLDAIGDEIPIGRPLANTDVLVLDACGGLAPPTDEGELVIGGKGVARGYLGRDELTRERFVPHPFKPNERIYRTGDLACFGTDGALRFRGRLDQQTKIRGYRIEIGEIEAVLGEHAAVRECVVVAREDTPGDKRLVGYIVPRGKPAAPAELRAYLLERLPEYMVPSAFVFLAAFPQTPNKKVDRKALPKPERERTTVRPETAAAPPQSSAEELVAGIWREVLNVGDIGTNDNFFDLGGHSLLTIQVLGKLKAKVTRPVSLVDLFRFPTIRTLAAFLDSEEEPPASLGESAARGAERQRIRRAMAERRRGG